jgi:hypothetical protein
VLGAEHGHVNGAYHYDHDLPQEHHLQPAPDRGSHLGYVMLPQMPLEQPPVKAVLNAQREEKGEDPEAEKRAVAQAA